MRNLNASHPSADGGPSGLTSLLWPPDVSADLPQRVQLSQDVASDLDLGPVLEALTGAEHRRVPFVTELLLRLCADAEVITYRHEIIGNLLEEPDLRERLAAVLSALAPLVRERRGSLFGTEWTVSEVIERLGELELYVDAAVCLTDALDSPQIRAPALGALRTSVRAVVESAEFVRLREELPRLRQEIDSVQSVTIGVNLSSSLMPESATVLSIEADKIEGRPGLLQRLFRKDGARRGMTVLRGAPGNRLGSFFPPMAGDGQGHENVLVEDLTRLLEHVVAPVGKAIEQYVWVNARDFVRLEAELAFMLNAVSLTERLRDAGLPVCRPQITAIDDRTTCLEACYNMSLALRMMGAQSFCGADSSGGVITNPVQFDTQRGRVWILTGPNRGGKTTYARAVGLAHLLFQAGLYVPAGAARMSPVDAIFTHFPNRESAMLGEGRLDDEARRLAQIFTGATPRSLILLNEVLSGTNTLEALGLALDAVRGLHLLGVRAVYVTHLHELATYAAEINDTTPGDGTVGSLVADADDTPGSTAAGHRRTFRIRPRPPQGISYASEIAEQHGIGYSQLVELLRGRGMIR